eukprot:14894854-Alexandrium_andersonii.AAC.1
MSASLVGSEMCIRDSLSTRSFPRGRRLREKCEPLRLGPRRASGGAPVSYTHLTLPTICSV